MFKVTVFDYINVHDMWLLTRLNFLEALSIPSHWSLHDLVANHLEIIGRMPSEDGSATSFSEAAQAEQVRIFSSPQPDEHTSQQLARHTRSQHETSGR